MPNFWQFPTVSMGLGPIMAIYHARFNKYLHARELFLISLKHGVLSEMVRLMNLKHSVRYRLLHVKSLRI